jgi:hypothetical protein
MSDEKDILNDAIASFKQQPCPGLPPQLAGQTLERLTEAENAPATAPWSGNIRRRLWPMAKIACAAGVILCVGYGLGILSRPKPIDVAHLQAVLTASLEPTLRENIGREMDQRYQLALANTYVRVKAELTQQYHDDMNRFAAQTLAASNAVTNRLLGELVDTIQTEQNRDIREIAAAITQIERNRLIDRQALVTEFTGELRETRQEFAQLLATSALQTDAPQDPTPSDPRERID